ncbi:MAG: hypothetical protein V4525_12045 [Pseudomonadota bacterium]
MNLIIRKIYSTDFSKNIFGSIHFIACIGFFLRIWLVFFSDYIYYPDELYSYLEQAHRLVFGYGYIVWEYRFGLRSWFIPGILSCPLFILKWLNLDDPNIYINVIKVICCSFSLSLIYTTYIVGKNIFSERVGKFASISVCFWYELIIFSSRPMPEVLATYCFMGALACAVNGVNKTKPYLFGLLLSLTVMLRLQYFFAIIVLGGYYFLKEKNINILKAIASVGLVFLLFGYLDYVTWGGFFYSFYANFLYNKTYGISKYFGVAPFYSYLIYITIVSMGVFMVSFCENIYLAIKKKHCSLLLLCLLSIIITNSFFMHKEYRFIFICIPLFLLLYFSQNVSKIVSATALLFIISLAGAMNFVPFLRYAYTHHIYYESDSLKAYKFLYKEKELISILNLYDREVAWTGGYYYLHHNVPIYFLNDVKEKKILSQNYKFIFSHIITKNSDAEANQYLNDFEVVAQLNDLKMWKNSDSKLIKIKLEDTAQVPFPIVDNYFKPFVKPHI